MVKLRNGGDRWFVALAACLGVGLLIFLGQLETVRLSYIRLNEYRDNLLSHSVNVAQSGRNTLVAVNSSREVLCSDDNITTLRRLAFKAHYLRDIGRIKDNRIICTALWGRLAIPVELPAWDREAEGGHRLWAKASGIGKHLEPVDMVARGSGIVFTSPVAFALYENPEQNLSAHVLTRNGKYIYRTFGAAHELTTQVPEQLAWYDLRSRRIVSSCSEDIDICVIAALSGVSLFQQPTSVFLALVAFGAIAGGGLGVAAIRWRRGYSSLPQQIKRAISEGRINVVYQPLVAFKNGRVKGAEVLARLRA